MNVCGTLVLSATRTVLLRPDLDEAQQRFGSTIFLICSHIAQSAPEIGFFYASMGAGTLLHFSDGAGKGDRIIARRLKRTTSARKRFPVLGLRRSGQI